MAPRNLSNRGHSSSGVVISSEEELWPRFDKSHGTPQKCEITVLSIPVNATLLQVAFHNDFVFIHHVNAIASQTEIHTC